MVALVFKTSLGVVRSPEGSTPSLLRQEDARKLRKKPLDARRLFSQVLPYPWYSGAGSSISNPEPRSTPQTWTQLGSDTSNLAGLLGSEL